MVLNPLSILNLFDNTRFGDYWIQTNPSVSFLSKIAKENPLAFLGGDTVVSQETLGNAEVGTLGALPALFQTGYLTLDKITTDKNGFTAFTLKIPNLEVNNKNWKFFLDNLYQFLHRNPEEERDTFFEAVEACDAAKLSEIFDSVLSGLPAEHHSENESCYHKVLFGYYYKFGHIVIPERKAAIGNTDLLVILPDRRYVIIELKFDTGDYSKRQDALLAKLAQKALDTIDTKEYWRPYMAEAKHLLEVGVGVSYRGQSLALLKSVK
jgi:hypothetical protein